MRVDWTGALVILFVIAVSGLAIYLYYTRANDLLRRWAEQNGYQIIHSEHRYLHRGPFFWTTSRNQVVMYVQVVDAQGYQRGGYVRLGSWWWGLFSNQVEVRWEEEQEG